MSTAPRPAAPLAADMQALARSMVVDGGEPLLRQRVVATAAGKSPRCFGRVLLRRCGCYARWGRERVVATAAGECLVLECSVIIRLPSLLADGGH